jgi:hypothetical protein
MFISFLFIQYYSRTSTKSGWLKGERDILPIRDSDFLTPPPFDTDLPFPPVCEPSATAAVEYTLMHIALAAVAAFTLGVAVTTLCCCCRDTAKEKGKVHQEQPSIMII